LGRLTAKKDVQIYKKTFEKPFNLRCKLKHVLWFNLIKEPRAIGATRRSVADEQG
jgi:hypothetical protein